MLLVKLLRLAYNLIMFFSKNKEKQEDYPQNIIKRLEALEQAVQKSKGGLQKVGIVRFNPFGEVGGNQSFCIAVLNENNDGFVLTSHYGREANRVYAKPIKASESTFLLSKEEKKAIEEAAKTKHDK